MRADCRHYSRRTGASGEVTEQCDVDAAPDAPLRCPEACPQHEPRKLSTLGFDHGTLGDARDATADEAAADADVDALFAAMRGVVEDVADAVVADDAERRRAAEVQASRKRRKRIR